SRCPNDMRAQLLLARIFLGESPGEQRQSSVSPASSWSKPPPQNRAHGPSRLASRKLCPQLAPSCQKFYSRRQLFTAQPPTFRTAASLSLHGALPDQAVRGTFPRCRVRSLLRTGFALLSRHVLRRLLPALAAVRLSQLAQVFEYVRRDAFGHGLMVAANGGKADLRVSSRRQKSSLTLRPSGVRQPHSGNRVSQAESRVGGQSAW